MNLSLLILLPLLTAIAVLFCNGQKQVRNVALAGSSLQLLLSFFFLSRFYAERQGGSNENMLFQSDYSWFAPLNIHFHTGVDGISLAMILLTAFVVLAGVLVSWKVADLSKEFFFLLLLLSAGAYGFFISLDLFTMFFFLEIAVIPKFLLIGIWAAGRKIKFQ